jgi:hypothetical protein
MIPPAVSPIPPRRDHTGPIATFRLATGESPTSKDEAGAPPNASLAASAVPKGFTRSILNGAFGHAMDQHDNDPRGFGNATPPSLTVLGALTLPLQAP